MDCLTLLTIGRRDLGSPACLDATRAAVKAARSTMTCTACPRAKAVGTLQRTILALHLQGETHLAHIGHARRRSTGSEPLQVSGWTSGRGRDYAQHAAARPCATRGATRGGHRTDDPSESVRPFANAGQPLNFIQTNSSKVTLCR